MHTNIFCKLHVHPKMYVLAYTYAELTENSTRRICVEKGDVIYNLRLNKI